MRRLGGQEEKKTENRNGNRTKKKHKVICNFRSLNTLQSLRQREYLYRAGHSYLKDFSQNKISMKADQKGIQLYLQFIPATFRKALKSMLHFKLLESFSAFRAHIPAANAIGRGQKKCAAVKKPIEGPGTGNTTTTATAPASSSSSRPRDCETDSETFLKTHFACPLVGCLAGWLAGWLG